MTFQDLQLIAPLLKAVAEEGYTTPSPIQQKAIPPVLAGRDLVGCAQTGTGKTAAFALPILQRLCAQPLGLGKRPIRALVLTPTRELAIQILESFQAYGRTPGCAAACCSAVCPRTRRWRRWPAEWTSSSPRRGGSTI